MIYSVPLKMPDKNHIFVFHICSGKNPRLHLARAKAMMACFAEVICASKYISDMDQSSDDTGLLHQVLVVKSVYNQDQMQQFVVDIITEQLGGVFLCDDRTVQHIRIDLLMVDGDWINGCDPRSFLLPLISALHDVCLQGDFEGRSSVFKYTSVHGGLPVITNAIQRTALVTGGGKRVGRALVLALAKAGYHIILHYHRSKKEALSVARLVERHQVTCTLWCFDLRTIEGLEPFMASRKIDLLVNCAAVYHKDQLDQCDLSVSRKILEANLLGPLALHQVYAKTQDCGHIINFLDKNITKNYGSRTSYLLAKRSLAILTEMAACELAPRVRVNAIAPGWLMDPEAHQKPWADYDHLLMQRRLSRKGDLADLVHALLFLECNDQITGQVMFIDGGEHLRD